MVRIYEHKNSDLTCVKDYDNLVSCSDGLREYLFDKGYNNIEVEDLLGYVYFEKGYRHCILDLSDNLRIISEEI